VYLEGVDLLGQFRVGVLQVQLDLDLLLDAAQTSQHGKMTRR